MNESLELAIKNEVDKHTEKLNAAHNERMRDLEAEMADRVETRTKELTNRMLWAAAAVIGVVVGAAAFSLYGAMREVNGQVMTLQSSIISAGDAIRNSEKELNEQTAKLAEANVAISVAAREIEQSSRELNDLRSRRMAAPAR